MGGIQIRYGGADIARDTVRDSQPNIALSLRFYSSMQGDRHILTINEYHLSLGRAIVPDSNNALCGGSEALDIQGYISPRVFLAQFGTSPPAP